jgi:hypothetical protein
MKPTRAQLLKNALLSLFGLERINNYWPLLHHEGWMVSDCEINFYWVLVSKETTLKNHEKDKYSKILIIF